MKPECSLGGEGVASWVGRHCGSVFVFALKTMAFYSDNIISLGHDVAGYSFGHIDSWQVASGNWQAACGTHSSIGVQLSLCHPFVFYAQNEIVCAKLSLKLNVITE